MFSHFSEKSGTLITHILMWVCVAVPCITFTRVIYLQCSPNMSRLCQLLLGVRLDAATTKCAFRIERSEKAGRWDKSGWSVRAKLGLLRSFRVIINFFTCPCRHQLINHPQEPPTDVSIRTTMLQWWKLATHVNACSSGGGMGWVVLL